MKYFIINYLQDIEFIITVTGELQPGLDEHLKEHPKSGTTEEDYTDYTYSIADANTPDKTELAITAVNMEFDYKILTPKALAGKEICGSIITKLRVLLNFMHNYSEDWKNYGAYKAIKETDMKEIAQ